MVRVARAVLTLAASCCGAVASSPTTYRSGSVPEVAVTAARCSQFWAKLCGRQDCVPVVLVAGCAPKPCNGGSTAASDEGKRRSAFRRRRKREAVWQREQLSGTDSTTTADGGQQRDDVDDLLRAHAARPGAAGHHGGGHAHAGRRQLPGAPSKKGPFIAYARSFERCDSQEQYTYTLDLRPSHFNPARPFETQTVSGNMSMKKELDDNLWVRVSMALRSNNEWKENAFIFKFPGNACSSIREHLPAIFRLLSKATNTTPAKDRRQPCVFPRGSHTIENEPMKWEFPKFKIMPYGRYKFRVQMGAVGSQENLFCNWVDCEVIPRPA
ncbi:uncharacterized protein LOC117645510 [Thrips palmi]|uniref:Uncharacterized protein LOC117645510 n=1 Tax=Thrips palmi TaxID=161013 RepID=A0A6P8YWM0_THRPL|nr:uncharacterized protein LOC117645510 [Thrips palmi]